MTRHETMVRWHVCCLLVSQSHQWFLLIIFILQLNCFWFCLILDYWFVSMLCFTSDNMDYPGSCQAW